MNNFDHAADATATSINSAGSAMRENEAFQESLEYQTNNLKATFQDLANNVIDKELISSVLKLGDAFLKLANTDIGVLVTKIGLLTGAGWGLSSLVQVSKIIPVIVGQFKNFGAVLSLVSEGSGTFGAALSAAGGAGAVALPIFLAVSAAIVGIVEAVKAYKESHPDFDTAAQSVATLSDSLKTAQDRLDEINKLGWKDRTRAINEEEQELKDLIAQQERELQVAQMRQAMAAGEELSERTGYGQATRYTAISPNDVDNQTFASMDEAVKSLAETEGITGESTDELKQKLLDLGYAFVTTTENTKLTADEMNALDIQALRDLTNSIKKNGELNTNLSDSYQGLYEQLAPTYEQIVSLEKAYTNAVPGSRALTASERELKGAFEELVGTMVSFDSVGESAYQIIANLANILGVTPQYAKDLAVSMGMVSANTQVAAGTFEQLADGTWTVAEQMKEIADSVESTSTSFAQYETILSSYQDTVDGVAGASDRFVSSLFNQNGELTEAAKQALSTDSAMAGMASSIITAQQAQAKANFSVLIQAIQDVGSAAMITSQQIASMMAMAGVNIGGASTTSVSSNLARTYKETTGKTAASNEAAYKAWLQEYAYNKYQNKLDEYKKQLEELKGYVPSGGGGGGSRKSAEEKAAEEAEKQAKKAQKAQEKAAKESQQAYESAAKSAEQAAQQAAQAAEQAAEEAKQKILDSIQELKDTSDKFWDSKTDAIEETNKELDRQKQLEEKLKALEEAKQKKILLYKNGQFQYDKDYGTIAKAKADYEETRDKIQRERELEQLEEMKDNATEIFNEMKDIVQNGGDVTQEMIDSWLSQMQADGADYYDSNKQMLSEWLDWAKNNIGEFIQSTSETLSGYASGAGSSSATRGAYGTNASTKGEGYLNDPKYWKNGEFVGLSVAWWMDIFERQIKKGQLGDYTTTDAWLGGIPGSSVFDDWKEVLEYWAKKDGGDPYAMQDMLERFEAAQIVLSNYADIFKSLGRTDLANLADKYKDLDVSAYHREAILKGVAAHPTDPFGWQSMTPAYRGTKVTTSGQLWRLMSDIIDLDTYLNDYTGEGSPYKTAFGQAFLHSNRDWHINKLDESDRYEFAEFDTEELKAAYEENEDAIRKLSEAWFDATKDYEREAIHAQAELRREARDRMEELLGYEPSGRSEAERQANRVYSVSLFEKKKAQVDEKNAEDIKDYLSQIKEGSNISQKYIDNAREYIGNLIEENSKKWFDLYDQTEKDKLHEQNEQYRAILEQLERAEQVGNVTGGDMLQWEKELDSADEWLAGRVKELEAQMAANSKAWWETEDEEERKRLHEENERLADEIDQLTGTTSTYEGHTGTWSWSGSKNARGTHNFMPKGESGISLVGENGPELRVLTRGDNIIPADQTENLWKWSNITPQAVLATLSSKSSSGTTNYAFDVSRIELPNVTDAKSFVQGLKNYALQYSYKR